MSRKKRKEPAAKSRYVTSLDGLRAICALAVVGYHMKLGWCTGGLLGVTVLFVLSGYVPILGGYLSQGFDLISAGCVLIKNSIGMIGIIAVLYLVLKPILQFLHL